MAPNTTIKMIGKRREKTTEVGLRSMASKLALAMASAALSWLYLLGMKKQVVLMKPWVLFE
jgi:hypothetical protein